MYMQNGIVATAVPAFHLDPPRIDPVERKGEIEQVIALATAAIPKAQMRRLVRLTFAEARDDDDQHYFGQIRSEPMAPSGLELRFPISARGTGKRNLEHLAAELAEGADCVARNGRALKKLGAIVREAAEAAIEPANGGISQMRLVAIGVTPGRTADALKVSVDVEMLGDDLTSGIERVCEHAHGGGIDRLKEKLGKLAAKHVERRKLLAQAKVAGATGWFDGSALRVLGVSGLGRAIAVEMLRRDRQVDFSFGGEEGYDLMGGVYWDDGVVRGYVENRDRKNTYRLEATVLTLEANRLPATIVASLAGRHLGEVMEFEYVPGNALIVDVEESGDWLYLHLEIGKSTIEDAIATS